MVSKLYQNHGDNYHHLRHCLYHLNHLSSWQIRNMPKPLLSITVPTLSSLSLSLSTVTKNLQTVADDKRNTVTHNNAVDMQVNDRKQSPRGKWNWFGHSTTVDTTRPQKKRAINWYSKSAGVRDRDCRLLAQLEEDGAGGSRRNWMEKSGLWHMLHWEQQGISQSHKSRSVT